MDDVQVNVPQHDHEMGNSSSAAPQSNNNSGSAVEMGDRWLRIVELFRSCGYHKATFIASIIVSILISIAAAGLILLMLIGLGVMGANHTQYLRQTYADGYWVLQIFNFIGPIIIICSCVLSVIVIRAERFSFKFGKTSTTIVRY